MFIAKSLTLKVSLNFRNFRTQIFVAFTLMLILIIVWFLFRLANEQKVNALDDLTFQTNRVSKDFSTNINNFQSFLLFGYKEKNFYITENEPDINRYINNLQKQKAEVGAILKKSTELNVDLNRPIFKLSKDLDSLCSDVVKFKKAALIRGFKNYGIEGQMRTKAHALESSAFDKVTLLQLRRHEKDYLLRAEEDYYRQFENLIEKAIAKEKDTTTKRLLVGYKSDFEQLVKLSLDLGFSQNQGLYGKINYLNVFVEDSFVQISQLTKTRVNGLKARLFNYQLIQTIILALIGLFLSLYISRYFTKDIEKLTLDISNYIKSNFKENTPATIQKSPIGEVNYLLKSYGILKETLAANIDFLEKTTEKANRTAEFKSQFLANMSHEIRTPLNGVIGMLDLLKSKKLSDEELEYIDIAEHSANHLLGIVNMILDHSKLEAGKIKTDQYPINLKTELDKLVRLFDYRIKGREVGMNFIFDNQIETNILGDNLRLQQILMNLIDNAIKFTEKGVITLQVQQLACVDNIETLRFSVEDSGIGIDVDKVENLLKAFEQADLTTTRKYGGTGLGLTISNQLVQLLGGTHLHIVALKSGGSRFSFEIPFPINPEALIAVDHGRDSENKVKIKNKKALLAEDNLINQKVFCKLLEKLDVTCDVANNGIEAVSLYLKNDYDIIFMDLHMPEMDGFEATGKIQESSKYKMRPTSIVAVTASVLDEDRAKALANGMNDFITKPVMLQNLGETIARQIK